VVTVHTNGIEAKLEKTNEHVVTRRLIAKEARIESAVLRFLERSSDKIR
jgi:hypothetical protein